MKSSEGAGKGMSRASPRRARMSRVNHSCCSNWNQIFFYLLARTLHSICHSPTASVASTSILHRLLLRFHLLLLSALRSPPSASAAAIDSTVLRVRVDRQQTRLTVANAIPSRDIYRRDVSAPVRGCALSALATPPPPKDGDLDC